MKMSDVNPARWERENQRTSLLYDILSEDIGRELVDAFAGSPFKLARQRPSFEGDVPDPADVDRRWRGMIVAEFSLKFDPGEYGYGEESWREELP